MSQFRQPAPPPSAAAPPYTRMGRNQLIAYCERLREVIQHAAPLTWAYLGDMAEAEDWEREACRALASHSTLDP